MPSATSSQTIGPFWHLIGHPEWADLTRFGTVGARITLTGSVVDGDGNPVTDAAVELWQADPPTDETFPGFGRCRSSTRSSPLSHGDRLDCLRHRRREQTQPQGQQDGDDRKPERKAPP